MADNRPVRLQFRRVNGFNLQAHSLATNGLPAVLCTRPGRWGNPFVMHHAGSPIAFAMDAKMAVALFKHLVEKEGGWFPTPLPWPKGKVPAQYTSVEDVKTELRGKNLACFCAILDKHGNYLHCHADVLLSLANQVTCEEVRDENIRRAKGETVR